MPPEPPKFIRDGMKIDDIEGSRPIVKKEFAPRDTLNCFDIQGAQAKKSNTRTKKGDYDNIAYNDVTGKKWASKRQTNPLDPTYSVWDEMLCEFGKKAETIKFNSSYGAIPGGKPAGLPRAVSGVRNLNTQDIDGAQQDTRNKGAFTWMDRRQTRSINVTSDIAGCQADTLKRAFVGKRNLNPLEPNYFYPGDAENANNVNDPFGEKTCSMSAANFKTAVNFGVKALKKDTSEAAGV